MKNTTKILKLVILAFAVAVLSSLLVTAAYAETVASGNFATAVANATWTYTLDSDGTLTIGGRASDGSTTFIYGAKASRYNCPWTREGKINGVEIKKIVILEETGIVTLGDTALAYLPYCEEIVLPSTVTTLGGYEDFISIPRLKTISVHGRTDAGEGIYDLRNFTGIPYRAFRFCASGVYFPEGIEVWLGENTSLPWYSDPWRIFYGMSSDTDGTNTTPQADLTAKVTFKVAKGSSAENYVKNKIAQQANYPSDLSKIDRTTPLNIELKYYNPKGTFANSYAPNATWTWELDRDTGVLTVGGQAVGSSTFYYGAEQSRAYCPWQRTGKIDGVEIKKIVILPETGITTIDTTSLAYAIYCEEIVLPASVTKIQGYEPMVANFALKTISVYGEKSTEGVYDFRNITSVAAGALNGCALSTKVPGGVEIWLGQSTSIPSASSSWYLFGPQGLDGVTYTPDAKVTFKVHKGSAAEAAVLAKIEQQNGANPDTTAPKEIAIKYFNPMGTFAIGANYQYATWTWELDVDGTLTIGGKATDSRTTFSYGAEVGRGNCPWQRTGIINGIQIKKVILLEETGITTLGATALSYLPYCEEIVLPATVTSITNYEAMCGNPRLKTVSVAGVTDAGEGIYDFRNITNLGWGDKSLLGNADARYVPEGIEVWLGESTGVPDASKNWYWFGALASEGVQPAAKVIIKVVSGSDAAAKVLNKVQQQKGENPDPNMAANIEIAYFLPPTNGTDETYGYYSWDFDTKTGTLTFTRLKEGWAELYFPHGGITAWIDAYRDQIKHIVIPNFSQYSDSRGLYPFSNLPNLETVKFDTKQIANGGGKDGKGMFYNCPKLKTFGASQSFEEGVIDLSNITFTTIDKTIYLKNMFYGCKSIEKVLWNNIKFMKSEVEVPFVIGASMFENCTNLRSVDISGATAIHSAAFKNCSSLGGTVLYSGDANIGDAFYGCGGVVISTDSTEKISAMLASMQNAGVSIKNAMVSCMSHGGFAVRTKDYNGLRSFYSFVGETNVDFDNLTLVEYGSIVGAAENYELYTKDIGGEGFIFTLEGNEFKTPTGIVKTAIYIAEGYTGDIAKHKTVNEKGTVDFVVTVTNFAPVQYNRNVIMNGYEIWEDAEGNYYLIITEYPYDDYKVNSLYKTTMGMLIDGIIDIGDENTPVNDVVNSVSKTVFDCGNENVTSFLVPHHLKAGKKIAVYSTDSEETIELNDLGIPAEELPYVADYAFSGNITCKLPKIDDYWMEHINEQLAAIPEGKSFIAITDTHYESGGRGNIGKSADLMQYVRKTSGISKVVNLGDPFHQENTYEGALKQLSRSMEEKFFDYFGDDGIYAIGNHDSNITIARTIDDDDPGTYKMDILLSDKDIYNRTVAHVAAGGEKNGNVIFNEELIEIIKANKDDIGAFVLDNVAPENSVNSKFGNVNYSAEEMYENLLDWAKLHYAYYDHDAKICYIVLNTGGLTLTDFTTLNLELWKFNPCQYNFVAKILNQVSESYSDYNIVVAGHMLYNSEYPDSAGNGDLFRMLSAFEAGTSVSFTASGNNALSGKLFGCTDGSTSRTLSYDFTENYFTGEIICISGHWHVDLQMISQTENGAYIYNSDYNTTSADSEDSLPLFVLNQDNAREKMSDAEPDTQVPVEGTITEQCFTIFTITEDNKIVITRIGANSGWLQKTFDMK